MHGKNISKESQILFEKVIDLLPEEQQFINTIANKQFINKPFKYLNRQPDEKNPTHEMYTYDFVLNKAYNEPNTDSSIPEEGKIVSPYWPKLENLFKRICNENDIIVNRIFRACINLSGYEHDRPNTLYAKPHRDHKFDHHIFLFYANEFTHGYTFLFDTEGRITEFVSPSKNKAVIIPNVLHARGFTSPKEEKILINITFEKGK